MSDLIYRGKQRVGKNQCHAHDVHNEAKPCPWKAVVKGGFCRMISAHNALNAFTPEQLAEAEAKRAADEAAKAAAIEAEKQAKLDKANRAALAEAVLKIIEEDASDDSADNPHSIKVYAMQVIEDAAREAPDA